MWIGSDLSVCVCVCVLIYSYYLFIFFHAISVEYGVKLSFWGITNNKGVQGYILLIVFKAGLVTKRGWNISFLSDVQCKKTWHESWSGRTWFALAGHMDLDMAPRPWVWQLYFKVLKCWGFTVCMYNPPPKKNLRDHLGQDHFRHQMSSVQVSFYACLSDTNR